MFVSTIKNTFIFFEAFLGGSVPQSDFHLDIHFLPIYCTYSVQFLLNGIPRTRKGEAWALLRVHKTRLRAPSWPIIGVYNNPSIFNVCSQIGLPCSPVNTCWIFWSYFVVMYVRHPIYSSCFLLIRCSKNAEIFSFGRLFLFGLLGISCDPVL